MQLAGLSKAFSSRFEEVDYSTEPLALARMLGAQPVSLPEAVNKSGLARMAGVASASARP
jgi:hypothetical protein